MSSNSRVCCSYWLQLVSNYWKGGGVGYPHPYIWSQFVIWIFKANAFTFFHAWQWQFVTDSLNQWEHSAWEPDAQSYIWRGKIFSSWKGFVPHKWSISWATPLIWTVCLCLFYLCISSRLLDKFYISQTISYPVSGAKTKPERSFERKKNESDTLYGRKVEICSTPEV